MEGITRKVSSRLELNGGLQLKRQSQSSHYVPGKEINLSNLNTLQITVIPFLLIIIGCAIWMELGVLSLNEILHISLIHSIVEGELEGDSGGKPCFLGSS